MTQPTENTDDAPPVVDAEDLRVGDVMFDTAMHDIEVADVLNLFGRSVVVTWRRGGVNWVHTYGLHDRVQLLRRGQEAEGR
ncbi:hypothetical protein [Streptomyces sp. NBC_00076]|uniref:hypothetical protein n=1 Tax=Streptomyces sp. NBC_00076 TaxID=2975642 RepID=UPI00324CFD54